MNDAQNQFARLMQRLRAGDETAARELLDEYGEAIHRTIRRHFSRRLRSKFDSQDFAQAVWASFFANVETVAQLRSPEMLVAYLSRMAVNKVIDEGRRRLTLAKHNLSGERSLTCPDDGSQREVRGPTPTPSQVVMADECWKRLVERWEEVLSAQWANQQPQELHSMQELRTVLELRANGATYEQIAAATNLSERTIRRMFSNLQIRISWEP